MSGLTGEPKRHTKIRAASLSAPRRRIPWPEADVLPPRLATGEDESDAERDDRYETLHGEHYGAVA